MNKKLVIFDFDGVLINTSDLCFSLHARQNPWMSREYFDGLSHGNFYDNVELAIKNDGFVINQEWYKEYSEGLVTLSTHDIIRQLIVDVQERHTLSICSSMESKYIIQALEREGIVGCFTDILGTDIHRSKVVKIRMLLERHGLRPSEAVFVTDTIGDIREGRECAVAAIGVTWGMQDRAKLQSEQPYAVVDTVPELEAAIERFFMV